MAVTTQEIDAADQRVKDADAAIKQAEVAHAEVAKDPEAAFDGRLEVAKAAITAAKGEHSRARQALGNLRTRYDKENPKTPADKTPVKTATEEANEAERQRQRAKNKAETGLDETDIERANREEKKVPKPDSPVEIANANTRAAENAERVRSNLTKEQLDVINAQREALVAAGTLFNTLRGQVSREAKDRADIQMEGIRQTRGAAESLVSATVQQRDQNVRLQTARMAFIQDVLTTAMPKVADMMMNLEEGDPTARNFMLTFLAMMHSAFKEGGLGINPAELDPNSPEVRKLRKIADLKIGDKLPEYPSASEVTMDTAIQSAAANNPLPGWNGPIGIQALDIPPMPPGTKGDGTNPLRDAAQSDAGITIEREIKQRVSTILAKSAEQRTPQENATLKAAEEEYKARIKALADAKSAQAPKPAAPPTTPEPTDPRQALRDEIREALISGDSNQKFNIMSIAMTAQQNARAGKPLSPKEKAILENLAPEDIAIINQNISPEVANVMLSFGQGQKPTPEQVTMVQNSINNVTTGIKTRKAATPTTTAAPTKPTQPPTAAGPTPGTELFPRELLPREIPFEERIMQNEKELAQSTGDPELDSIMKEIDTEHRNYGLKTNFKPGYFGKSLREQAEERRKQKQAMVSPETMQPSELQSKIIADEEMPPDITGRFPSLIRPEDVEIPERRPVLDLTESQQNIKPTTSFDDENVGIPRLSPLFQNWKDDEEEEDPYKSTLFGGSTMPRFGY